MIAYLDSSVVLRILFSEPQPFKEFGGFDKLVSSALLRAECLRVLSRLRLCGAVSPEQLLAVQAALHEILRSVTLYAITSEILQRAGDDFPVALKTLDAIHFATFLNVTKQAKSKAALITHDKALQETAMALDLKTFG